MFLSPDKAFSHLQAQSIRRATCVYGGGHVRLQEKLGRLPESPFSGAEASAEERDIVALSKRPSFKEKVFVAFEILLKKRPIAFLKSFEKNLFLSGV